MIVMGSMGRTPLTYNMLFCDQNGKQMGSARESDVGPGSGGFPESNEFGPRRRHTLNLQQQVASVLVAPAAL